MIDNETVKSRLIAGISRTPFVGDITFEDINLAERFFDKFPVDSEFPVEDFDAWIFNDAIALGNPLPISPQPPGTPLARMFTLFRQDYLGRINRAARHYQWRRDDSFQILIEEKGIKWKVVSAAQAAVFTASQCIEKPKSISQRLRQRTLELADKANTSQMLPEERKGLIEALYTAWPPATPSLTFRFSQKALGEPENNGDEEEQSN